MDTFIEYMVKKKKTGKDIAKIFAAIAGAVVLSAVIGFLVTITPSVIFAVWFALLAAMWYGVYVIISRQNIEYEYTFTNGELDIDAVYSKRRRVHVLTVRVRDFSFCAPAYDSRYESRRLDVSGVKHNYALAGDASGENVYFADFLMNGDKMRLDFEPSRKMIEAIKQFNMRNVHLKDEA